MDIGAFLAGNVAALIGKIYGDMLFYHHREQGLASAR